MTDIKRTGYSWRELEKKAQDRKLLSRTYVTGGAKSCRLVTSSYSEKKPTRVTK